MVVRTLVISVVSSFILTSCGLQLGLLTFPQAKSGKALFVTTTNFQVGALARLDLNSREANFNFSSIFKDAVVRSFDEFEDVFVINRLGADNIQRINPLDGKTLSQISVDLGANPQDMVLDGQHAYISLFQRRFLRKIQIGSWATVREIDLQQYSDSDLLPEATLLRKSGRSLWIQLQKLNQFSNFTPEGVPQVIILDLDSDQISKVLTLGATNPITPFKNDSDGKWLLGEAGVVGPQVKLDGGIEKFDPSRGESMGFITTEQSLGGDLVDFECFSHDQCVAVISKPATELVVFDPRTGQKTATLWSSSGYHLRQVLWDSGENLLYLADGDPVDPQIRVWSTGGEIKARPQLNWKFSLPPYQMVLVVR